MLTSPTSVFYPSLVTREQNPRFIGIQHSPRTFTDVLTGGTVIYLPVTSVPTCEREHDQFHRPLSLIPSRSLHLVYVSPDLVYPHVPSCLRFPRVKIVCDAFQRPSSYILSDSSSIFPSTAVVHSHFFQLSVSLLFPFVCSPHYDGSRISGSVSLVTAPHPTGQNFVS